jgi:predicted GNAT family acetyltransferase
MVTNNRDECQYELIVDGHKALAAYRLSEGKVSFVHTEVPTELEGQGVASRLIEGALQQVREEGLKVEPLCSFVRHYVDSHPQVQDLVG